MKDKIIVITGGSRGIGAASVNCFMEAGARVAVLDRRVGEKWKKEPWFISCDVANEQEVNDAVKSIIEKWGQVDVLVNNAGIQRYGTVTETDSALWDEVMNVNLKSMFLCARAVLPQMQKAGRGVIVNVSSVQAFHSQQRVAAYVTSKTAILGLTRSIAVDYAPQIRCVAVCPGTVETEMWLESIGLDKDPVAVRRECENMHLTQRIAKPEEVADLIVYLSDDRAAFITGQAFRIDGGLGVVIQGTVKDEVK